ncbi:MFS transporter [Diaporthe amygdali]|uniref:MFS transporter n=1 Tax=Phomopsis amygdali TaxID=1214568 RepID=UPI0022FED079|nr:MFS transporter [Diaporthe amygdali]KAJ0121929.1 MFS transporter [Diaporthe amygdali]
MSRSMGDMPTNIGTQSFYRTLALRSLENHAGGPQRSEEPVDGLKDIVIELSDVPGTDETGSAADLTPSEKAYLTKRHGTFELDPMPSASDADPYNWPRGKKVTVLLLVGFHSMVASLSMTALIPAYSQMANKFGMTEHDCTYFTLIHILVLGVAPLAWGPLATVYGRRPVLLVSLIMSLIGNVACGVSPNYGAMMFFRALVAFFLSPANALSSAVVTDMFLKTERARYIGICTLMFCLGVPFGPFVFGFVTPRVSFRWIFWVLAIVNGVQFVLYFFLGHETLFIRHHDTPSSIFERGSGGFKAKYLNFSRVGSRRISKLDFLEPLALAAYPCAILPTLAQSVVFLCGSIFITIEIPVQLQPKFHLSIEQVGLQFLGMIIGCMIAEPVGGLLSDVCMSLRTRTREGYESPPELRLWLSHAGYCLILVGVPLFLVSTENAVTGRWTIVPVVGTAIAAGGNQIAMTTLATYAVDCAVDDVVSVGILMSLSRQLIAFIGPLWFPTMMRNVGLKWCAAIIYALIVILSILSTILVQWKGKHWR